MGCLPPPAGWEAVPTHLPPVSFDVNMDAVYVTPQLSGGNFDYARLPHASHAALPSGPIGGTYAIPSNPSDVLVGQLKDQHHGQSLAYGSSLSAVAHVPPSWTRPLSGA